MNPYPATILGAPCVVKGFTENDKILLLADGTRYQFELWDRSSVDVHSTSLVEIARLRYVRSEGWFLGGEALAPWLREENQRIAEKNLPMDEWHPDYVRRKVLSGELDERAVEQDSQNVCAVAWFADNPYAPHLLRVFEKDETQAQVEAQRKLAQDQMEAATQQKAAAEAQADAAAKTAAAGQSIGTAAEAAGHAAGKVIEATSKQIDQLEAHHRTAEKLVNKTEEQLAQLEKYWPNTPAAKAARARILRKEVPEEFLNWVLDQRALTGQWPKGSTAFAECKSRGWKGKKAGASLPSVYRWLKNIRTEREKAGLETPQEKDAMQFAAGNYSVGDQTEDVTAADPSQEALDRISLDELPNDAPLTAPPAEDCHDDGCKPSP